MSDRLTLREAAETFGTRPIEFLGAALTGDDIGRFRFTSAVLGVMLGLFGVEVGLMLLWGAPSTRIVVEYFFIHHPNVAWPLAPFLHRGIRHIAANAMFVYIAAPIEQRTSRRRYIVLLCLAGFLAVYADGLKLYLLGSEPHVAAYGTSGFAFGLLGYSLTVHIGTDWRLTPRWWLIVVTGTAAALTVVFDIFLATVDPISLDLGHLVGLFVGLVLGYKGPDG